MNKSIHNPAGQEPKETDDSKPFNPPTGPRLGKKMYRGNNPLKATAPASIPMPTASDPVAPAASKSSIAFNPSAPAFEPTKPSQTLTPPSAHQKETQPSRRTSGYFPVVVSGTTTPAAATTPRNQARHSMRQRWQPAASPMPMSTPGHAFGPRWGRRAPALFTPTNAVPGPLCQAIVHYHSCGCRAAGSPTFVCSQRGCSHERPTQVNVGYLPFSCTTRWSGNAQADPEGGRGPACRQRNPSTVGFRREEDTAVRGKGSRSFQGGAITLEDLPEVIPTAATVADDNDAEKDGEVCPGPEAFEKWVDQLNAKCEAKEKEEKDDGAAIWKKLWDEMTPKIKESQHSSQSIATQTEWPEEEKKELLASQAKTDNNAAENVQPREPMHSIAVQTDEPPKPVMKSTGIQSDPAESREVRVETKRPAMKSTGIQPDSPVYQEMGIQKERPVVKSIGVQPNSPAYKEMGVQTLELTMKSLRALPGVREQLEIAVQKEKPVMKSQGTQYVKPAGDDDREDSDDSRLVGFRPYHPPYDYWDWLDMNYDEGESIDLRLDVDWDEDTDDEDLRNGHKSKGIVRSAFSLIRFIV